MCVSLPDSGHRALRVFLQGQGGVRGAGRAGRVQLWVCGPSLPALSLLLLWAVFPFGGGCRGARGAHAVLTEVFPG